MWFRMGKSCAVNEMIKNVMFDMGQVLTCFDRRIFLDRLELPEEDKQLLLQEVFLGPEWVQMDFGSLDEPEALLRMQARLPQRLHNAAYRLCCEWNDPILPIAGMYGLVQELKDAGYGIYLLSNASHRQHEYWPTLPVSKLFDGTVISADLGIIKPDPEIYRYAMKKFGLRPQEVFFIDDVADNVKGANDCGIPGAVFDGDVALLRKNLRKAGVRVSE